MRRGFSVFAVIFLIALITVGGLTFMGLARQSGKSSHWFYQSQAAFNIADTATREAFRELAQRNSARRAADSDARADPLGRLIRAVREGRAETIPLMSGPGATSTAGLTACLQGYQAYDPRVEVTVAALATSRPLWNGQLGLIADPAERVGRIQVRAKASVRDPYGHVLERTLITEKEYKVVGLLPALLGRFALFIAQAGGADANIVRAKVDQKTGDADPQGVVEPIVVLSGTALPYVTVPTDGSPIQRDQTAAASLAPEMLDKQGWVYLGPHPTRPWTLRVAHGYGRLGESMLFPGYRAHVEFGRSAAADAAFRDRFASAFQSAFGCPLTWPATEGGLYQFQHGFALDYQMLGNIAGSGMLPGSPPRPDAGPGESSCLRLYGRPDAVSPTLVFGPTRAAFVQRAYLFATQDAACTDPGIALPATGWLQLYSAAETPAGPQRTILQQAFGAELDAEGTSRREIAPACFLETLADPRIRGTVAPDGTLDPIAATPQVPTLRSSLLPWFELGPDGLAQDAYRKLADGDLSAPSFFKGQLSQGLDAFRDLTMERATYAIADPANPLRGIVSEGQLRLPGVIVWPRDAELALPAIAGVAEGGVLLARGTLRLTGDVRRSQAADAEPLTLIAGERLVVGPEVTRIDACIVSLGALELRNRAALTIKGTVACRTLDVGALRDNPAPRTIEHDLRMDPTQAPATSVDDLRRVYYGDFSEESRVSVQGN